MNQAVVLKIFEFVILVFALSLHEAAHAWMASRLGDPTARMLGRLTLNPAKHVDPFGTILVLLARINVTGAEMVRELAGGVPGPGLAAGSPAVPIAIFLYLSVWLNVILAVFNLIPLPPLDGSHVLRHFLPYKALRAYDSIGMIGLLVFLFLGGPLLGMFVNPLLGFVNSVLLNFAI